MNRTASRHRTLPHRLAAVAIAAAGLLPAGFAQAQWTGPAASQRPAAARAANASGMPAITAFDVRGVDRVEPGAELEFTLWGAPGANATISIDGAARPVSLAETSAGVYRGVYTVARRDRIAPNAHVVANLRRGNQVATAVLDEPLQQGYAGQGNVSQAAAVTVQSVGVTMADARQGGGIMFDVRGTPGGRALATLEGAPVRRVPLTETEPGRYTGSYVPRNGDQIDMRQPVQVRLRHGEQVATAQSDRPLEAFARQGTTRGWGMQPASSNCPTCATVEAINRVVVNGDGGVIGTVAGGVLGGVAGNQVGGGNGRTAATVAGAIGGAVLGREIERRRGTRERYEVVLRMNASGQRETVMSDDPPALREGEQVRLENGQIVR